MASSKRSVWRVVAWSGSVTVLVLAAFVAWLVVPIVVGSPQGQSGQVLDVEGYPNAVSALGDDGRERFLSASLDDELRSFDELETRDRIIVSGKGYDAASGIYVALCKVPNSPEEKPGPCLGGVGQTEEGREAIAGVIEYGASNWINDDWAWRLFGARSFDDTNEGIFSAYIEVPAASDENVDCAEVRCGLYTRNDHTALEDRVQDLYIPIAFGK